MGSTVKVIPVKNRLGMMLDARGGMARDDAVSAAGQNVETLRSVFIKAIPREVAALEAMLNATGRTTITKDELEAMLRRAGQILTLSGTYGFGMLDDVVKRFCDLAMGMIDKNIEQTAPVAVEKKAGDALVFETDFSVFGELNDFSKITLATKLAFFRNVINNTRFKLESYKTKDPKHPLAEAYAKLEKFAGAKDTKEELAFLHKQASMFARLLSKWNEVQ